MAASPENCHNTAALLRDEAALVALAARGAAGAGEAKVEGEAASGNLRKKDEEEEEEEEENFDSSMSWRLSSDAAL